MVQAGHYLARFAEYPQHSMQALEVGPKLLSPEIRVVKCCPKVVPEKTGSVDLGIDHIMAVPHSD